MAKKPVNGWDPAWLAAHAPKGPPKGLPSPTVQYSNTPSLTLGQQGPSNAPAPQPPDPALELAKLSAGYNVGLGNAEATYQQGQTAYQTGFNADGTLNTANPYSQATLLQQAYQRQKLGTTNSMAAAGQLYSGANVNAQNTNDRNYAQGYDALRQQALGAYHNIGVNQLQTFGANAAGVSGDQFNSLLKSVYGS